MYCSKCGAEISNETKFCSKCGNTVSNVQLTKKNSKETVEISQHENIEAPTIQPTKNAQPKSFSTKRNIIIIIIVALVVIIGGVAVLAISSGNGSGFEYTIENGEATVTKYTGNNIKVVIPSELGGAKVTGIGYRAFGSCGLTSITIPDSVTSIGVDAFLFCTSLASVNIPDSVTSIGADAFGSCTSLTELELNNDCYTTIDDIIFSKDMSELVVYPAGKNDITYTIPDSVTSIGGGAFFGCTSVTSITIPDSVKSIGGSAFFGCASITSITIPDGVTSIGGSTFLDCYSLTSITIPDSVTSIGWGAFSYCTSLTSITIPDGVTNINWCTFSHCTSLASITIPDSVTSIDERAFVGCENLTVTYKGIKYTYENYDHFNDSLISDINNSCKIS